MYILYMPTWSERRERASGSYFSYIVVTCYITKQGPLACQVGREIPKMSPSYEIVSIGGLDLSLTLKESYKEDV